MKHLWLVFAVACAPPATSEVESEIAHGTVASAQERPWAAFLEIRLQNDNATSCSGALVAPNKVLTAAHCAVCAKGITVKMLGASTVHTASTWSVHPQAFPNEPVNCALQSSHSDAEGKVNVGADLAVVTLATSSQVTPIPALTSPPYGWDPVTETSGPDIVGATIVGRGNESLNGGDLSTMREGDASIDALSKTPADDCDPQVPPSSTLPFLQLWRTGSEAAMLGGDSGGPMIASFYGAKKVVGVASWFCRDDFSYYAPTFAAETASFLGTAIGQYGSGADADGDHVPDGSDNCAGKGNPHQEDVDGDGVGDACDICKSVEDPEQKNCNAESEKALGATVRGDACDPTPCATVEMTWGQVPTSLVPAPFPQPCAVNGYAIASCHWEMPTGFDLRPVAKADASPQSGTIGLRHCRCTATHGTAEERESACRSPSTWACDVDGDLFPSGNAPWRATATPTTTVTFAPGAGSTVHVPWDSVADLEDIGTGSLPPPPWAPSNGFVGTARLDGIVWAHVIDRAGTPTANMGSLGGVPYVDLAGAYAPADHRFRLVYHWKKIPQYAPAWPWEYCAQCREVEMPWVSVFDPARGVAVGIGPDGARELSLPSDVLGLLSAGRVIAAAESPAELERAGVLRRAVVVRSDGAILGALSARRGVSAESLRGPALAGTDAGRLYAYSARRGELFAVRTSATAGIGRIERLGDRWMPFAITGAAIGVPLAVALDPAHDALYVVDRSDAVRLLRIDLVGGRSTVISPRLLTSVPRSVSLSLTAKGELLLAAGTELAWIDSDRLAGRATTTDTIVGEARELAHGVHFAGSSGASFVSSAARRPPRIGESLAPAF